MAYGILSAAVVILAICLVLAVGVLYMQMEWLKQAKTDLTSEKAKTKDVGKMVLGHVDALKKELTALERQFRAEQKKDTSKEST